MKLLIERYNYETIDRHSIEGKRLYACPDGSLVPSVTTILSATQPIEKTNALKKWRDSVGHKKAEEITTEAASRGTRMHKYLEDYILTGVLSNPGSNPYSQQSHCMAKTVVDAGLSNIEEVWGSEVGLYYPGLYAGTADAVGVSRGNAAILDFKQSNKPKKIEYISDYFLQLTAYALAHNKVHDTNIRKGVILMCVKPEEIAPAKWGTPRYQEFILHPSEFEFWEHQWWDRVELFYEVYRLNK